MKLEINKDFGREYASDVWRGFGLSQVASFAGAFAACVAAAAVMAKCFSVPLDEAVYLSVPFAAPPIALGFYRYRDQMGLPELLREMRFSRKTAKLYYEAGVYPGDREFTTESRPAEGYSDAEWKNMKKEYAARRAERKKEGSGHGAVYH